MIEVTVRWVPFPSHSGRRNRTDPHFYPAKNCQPGSSAPNYFIMLSAVTTTTKTRCLYIIPIRLYQFHNLAIPFHIVQLYFLSTLSVNIIFQMIKRYVSYASPNEVHQMYHPLCMFASTYTYI